MVVVVVVGGSLPRRAGRGRFGVLSGPLCPLPSHVSSRGLVAFARASFGLAWSRLVDFASCRRVVQELCQIARASNLTVVVPGVWEGPRLDGTCFHTTAVVTPPALATEGTGAAAGAAAGAGATAGAVAGAGAAAGAGVAAGTSATVAPALIDVGEVVSLYHHRTVTAEAQVPGVFPGCVDLDAAGGGRLGLVPDFDIGSDVFVREVVEVLVISLPPLPVRQHIPITPILAHPHAHARAPPPQPPPRPHLMCTVCVGGDHASPSPFSLPAPAPIPARRPGVPRSSRFQLGASILIHPASVDWAMGLGAASDNDDDDDDDDAEDGGRARSPVASPGVCMCMEREPMFITLFPPPALAAPPRCPLPTRGTHCLSCLKGSIACLVVYRAPRIMCRAQCAVCSVQCRKEHLCCVRPPLFCVCACVLELVASLSSPTIPTSGCPTRSLACAAERLRRLHDASLAAGLPVVHCEPCAPFGPGRSCVVVGGEVVGAAATTDETAFISIVPLPVSKFAVS